jgi:hypothetical protein
MTITLLSYSVGNEHDPGDPWGRSELVLQSDGSARLDHFFSRRGPTGAWTGRVDDAALRALWSALEQAGFPAAPTTPFTPGASPRRLIVEADGERQYATIDYHLAPKLPGYAEAFDLLDAIVRQVSREAVTYPHKQSTIVHDAAEAPSTTDA